MRKITEPNFFDIHVYSPFVVACVLALIAPAAFASEQGTHAKEETVRITQVLTIATCKGRGNLDEIAIVSSSSVFAALAPIVAMEVKPEGVAKNRDQLTKVLSAVQCDSQGVLQIK